MKYPKRKDWNEEDWKIYKKNALKKIKKPICINTAISMSYDLLELEKKIKDQPLEGNVANSLRKEVNAYKEARQQAYINIKTKLNTCRLYSDFCEETIKDAKKLFTAAIQRVDTGLTRDVWGSFENFSLPPGAKLFLDETTGASEKLREFRESPKYIESEKLREFCEYLFFTGTDDKKTKAYVVTPLGYLGQKIGMIFSTIDESSNLKDCARKFNNIAIEFASLLFRSLQAQAYRNTLSLLNVRHPKEAISILCEVLPLVFNITAIVFHIADAGKEKIIYGFTSANEGEIFDRLDESGEHKIVTDTLIEPNFSNSRKS
jgi:hypothetical protein